MTWRNALYSLNGVKDAWFSVADFQALHLLNAPALENNATEHASGGVLPCRVPLIQKKYMEYSMISEKMHHAMDNIKQVLWQGNEAYAEHSPFSLDSLADEEPAALEEAWLALRTHFAAECRPRMVQDFKDTVNASDYRL